MRLWEAIRVRRADVEGRCSRRIGCRISGHGASALERVVHTVARRAARAEVLG